MRQLTLALFTFSLLAACNSTGGGESGATSSNWWDQWFAEIEPAAETPVEEAEEAVAETPAEEAEEAVAETPAEEAEEAVAETPAEIAEEAVGETLDDEAVAQSGGDDVEPQEAGDLHLDAPLTSEEPSDPEPGFFEELCDSLPLLHGKDSVSVSVDGFLRATRLDAPASSLIPDAVLGTRIDHARLRLTGDVADFSYRLGVDAFNSDISLQDAWISHEFSSDVEFTLGQFRPPFLTSGLLDADQLFFPVRTRNGVFYSVRSPGIQAKGGAGRFEWSAALQDGVIDPSDQLVTARLSYDFTGGGVLPWEGALRSDFKPHFWAATSVSKEDVLDSNLARALELHYVSGRYSLACEWLGYGDDYDIAGGPWGPGGGFRGERRGATHPLSLTATYMFVPDRVELAVRWEDFDDNRGAGFTNTGVEADTDFDRKNLYIGINYYVDGHDMKIHLGQLHETRDGLDDSDDIYVWGVGVSLSF